MTDLKVYKDFADYIIEKTGGLESDNVLASELKREVSFCIKKRKPLMSYWKLLAYELFKKYKIADERITLDDKLESITYKVNGKEITTEINYMNFGVDKMPENSRLVLNSEREDEEEFIKRVMKRSIKRFPNCGTEKVYLWRNYMLVFTNE